MDGGAETPGGRSGYATVIQSEAWYQTDLKSLQGLPLQTPH